jgi:hypothetical protein
MTNIVASTIPNSTDTVAPFIVTFLLTIPKKMAGNTGMTRYAVIV